jgi:hypothetical protein
MGHERRFERLRMSPALPQQADYFGAELDFALGPEAELASQPYLFRFKSPD